LTKTKPKPASPPAAVNPAAMTPADLAALLSRAGGQQITEAMLRADLDVGGAPRNPDGSMNLMHYSAWLAQNLSRYSAALAQRATHLSTK